MKKKIFLAWSNLGSKSFLLSEREKESLTRNIFLSRLFEIFSLTEIVNWKILWLHAPFMPSESQL